MFGATFLVPVLTGFPVSTTLLFSGIGTILFLSSRKNKLPSYLGSSFAFIAPVTAATASAGMGSALAGIVAVGVLLAAVGFIVQFAGIGWIDKLMPPVVAGAIVALIGFNLAPVAWANFQQAPLTATITLSAVILFSVLFRGFLGRISIFLGVIVGYVVAVIRGEVDFTAVERGRLGRPPRVPHRRLRLARHVERHRDVPAGRARADRRERRARARRRDDDGCLGQQAHRPRAHRRRRWRRRSPALFGGSGTTTYGENIGVMAATRVYSTAAYWVAGVVAILLALSPKVGAVFNSIPPGVLGGVTTALYGLIGIIGIKIWVDNRVDFSRPVNQYTGAVALVIAIAGFTMQWGDFQLGAIVIGAAAALLIYHLGNADRPLAQDRRRRRRPDPRRRPARRRPPGRTRVGRFERATVACRVWRASSRRPTSRALTGMSERMPARCRMSHE